MSDTKNYWLVKRVDKRMRIKQLGPDVLVVANDVLWLFECLKTGDRFTRWLPEGYTPQDDCEPGMPGWPEDEDDDGDEI